MPTEAQATTGVVQCLPGPRSVFGESPFFDMRDGSIVHVDTLGRIIRHAADGAATSWPLGEPVAFAVPATGGGYLVGLARSGICRFDPLSGSVTPLRLDLSPAHQGNDATVDPLGRLIIGTRSSAPGAFDGLVAICDADGTKVVARGFGLVNGLAVDALGHWLFVADTHADVQSVWRYDYDLATGTVGGRRKIFDFHARPGRPDGAAVDAKGNLWLAEIGGGALVCIAPDGALIADVALPVSLPTKPCFDGKGRLVVTTASRGVDLVAEPAAGHLLALEIPGASITALAAV